MIHVTKVIRLIDKSDKHEFHKGWKASCSCGWEGPDRMTWGNAKDDAFNHDVTDSVA